jgi:hypothetical protein
MCNGSSLVCARGEVFGVAVTSDLVSVGKGPERGDGSSNVALLAVLFREIGVRCPSFLELRAASKRASCASGRRVSEGSSFQFSSGKMTSPPRLLASSKL